MCREEANAQASGNCPRNKAPYKVGTSSARFAVRRLVDSHLNGLLASSTSNMRRRHLKLSACSGKAFLSCLDLGNSIEFFLYDDVLT